MSDTPHTPQGAKDPDHCTPEFPGDGAKGHLEYDLIRMPPATLTPNKAASVEACQALCAAAAGAKDGCQYLFYNGSAPLAKRCMLRLKGVAPPKFDLTGPKQAAVVFEVGRRGVGACAPPQCTLARTHPPSHTPTQRTSRRRRPPSQVTPNNRYSAYPADPLDWAGLGVDIASFPTFRDAMVACGITPVCVGFKYDPAGGAKPYRTFAGTLWEGVTGKVRTTGPSLNPWAHYA